jgi:hypothetical protein
MEERGGEDHAVKGRGGPCREGGEKESGEGSQGEWKRKGNRHVGGEGSDVGRCRREREAVRCWQILV